MPFSSAKTELGSPITIGIEHFDRDAAPDAMIDVLVDFVEHLGGTSFVMAICRTAKGLSPTVATPAI